MDYLKNNCQQMVVLVFELDGKFVRKFRKNCVPFLCGYTDQLDHHLPIISDPITASIEHTIQGFQILTYQTSPTFFQHIEKSFKVSVCVYKSFTNLFRRRISRVPLKCLSRNLAIMLCLQGSLLHRYALELYN